MGDIRNEGRRSAIGRIRRGKAREPLYKNHIVCHADGTPGRNLNENKVCWNNRGYNRPGPKAARRRSLKRADRAAQTRFEEQAEGKEFFYGND